MSAQDLVAEICALRPEMFASRAVRAVQRKIDAKLRSVDLTALTERQQWAIANACSYARGECARHLTPEQAAPRC
jgi:hypothetical protein